MNAKKIFLQDKKSTQITRRQLFTSLLKTKLIEKYFKYAAYIVIKLIANGIK